MRRTRVGTLIGLGVAGLVVGLLGEQAIAGAGQAVFVPPVTLPLTLVLVAGIVVGFAIPIRRAVTGRSRRRVDPFQALRVVVLAKACGLAGALLTGAGVGVVAYLLSRSVLPPLGSVLMAVGMAVGAAVLLTAGLVAEHLCRVPPRDDDEVGGQPA